MKKRKDISISIIRIISMFLIINCHIFQGINNRMAYWLNIGVIIFLYISGYLYGKKRITNIKNFYIDRIKKIMVPYLVIFIPLLLLEILIFHERYSILFILGAFLGFGGFHGNITVLAHTWFISYILICYLITPLLERIFTNKRFEINYKYLIYLILFIESLQLFSLLSINVSYVITFILGYFYSKCCTEEENKSFYYKRIITILVILLPLTIIYQENINIKLPNILNNYSNIIIDYGHVFLGIIIFIVLKKYLNNYLPKNNKLLLFLDEHSYYIYLTHQIFILNRYSILYITNYLLLNIILIYILTILSSIILKRISDYVLEKMIKYEK